MNIVSLAKSLIYLVKVTVGTCGEALDVFYSAETVNKFDLTEAERLQIDSLIHLGHSQR